MSIEQIRIMKCGKCDYRVRQRILRSGRFDKINKCPKCETEGQMGMLRILTQMPGN